MRDDLTSATDNELHQEYVELATRSNTWTEADRIQFERVVLERYRRSQISDMQALRSKGAG
jgi:predicted  nucleic acid-binding Zn ribbon protein